MKTKLLDLNIFSLKCSYLLTYNFLFTLNRFFILEQKYIYIYEKEF